MGLRLKGTIKGVSGDYNTDRCRRRWEPAEREGDATTVVVVVVGDGGGGGLVDVATTWRQLRPSRYVVTSSTGACPVVVTSVTSAPAVRPTSWSRRQSTKNWVRYLATTGGGNSECRREELARHWTPLERWCCTRPWPFHPTCSLNTTVINEHDSLINDWLIDWLMEYKPRFDVLAKDWGLILFRFYASSTIKGRRLPIHSVFWPAAHGSK